MTLHAGDQGFLSPNQRRAVLALIQSRFGIRGSDYGAARVDGAVRSVLPTTDHADIDSLLASLTRESMPRWLFDMVEHLTVGETYFLRDPAQVAALRETILPDLVARRTTERRLRMWSAGCSTGEEVYTLAILLQERNLPSDWDISLVGTDVNRDSLRIAREARYPAWSFRATPQAVRDRYFEPVAGEWQLREAPRRMARFACANLGSDLLMAPLNDADLVVCRNVTIYFDDLATQRLYHTLVSALAPGGWLMLGPSDPVPADTRGLERVEVAGTVVWRRLAAPRIERPRSLPPTLTSLPVVGAKFRAAAHGGAAARRGNDLEAGLLALEAGSAGLALVLLRRATFHQPDSALAHFGLARAYVTLGDRARAQAALMHTRRLLLRRSADELVPGSDSMAVETLRQTIASYLSELAA